MRFFESWQELLRVAASAVLIYGFIVIAVRVVGKRATSQMNHSDWIVTVAIGSIVGSGVLLRDGVVLEVLVSVAMLLGLQYLVTKASAPWLPISRAVRARPRLLFYDGAFYDGAMAAERITREEVEAAVRGADATVSVLGRREQAAGLLQGVEGASRR